MKLNFILEKSYVRHNGHCIAQAVADFLSDDESAYLSISADSLAYPSHVTSELTNRMIRTPSTFQLENKKITSIIYCKNVN